MYATVGSSPGAAASIPAWKLWVRRLYVLIAGLTALAIAGQVFLAGAAVLEDPVYWAIHRSFGNVIELLGLAVVLVGFATRLPWRLQAWGWLLYALTFLQYVFLYLMPQVGAPLLRALHAVNALFLFGAAVLLVARAWQQRKRR